jgi:hypothetical protein
VNSATAFLGTSVYLQPQSTGGLENGPSTLSAGWLAAVERRVRDSVEPHNSKEHDTGKWVDQDVALRAMQFFQMASSVLPGEPFIYSSNGEDLIAEFKTIHGVLTGVISGPLLSIYAMTSGNVQKKLNFDLRTISSGSLQEQLKPMASLIIAGGSGSAVGT